MERKEKLSKLFGEPLLYLVADNGALGGRSLAGVVGDAVSGGAGIVQLREKETPAGEFMRDARALAAFLGPRGIPLIINDRLDIAMACGADGVHLGQGDVPVSDARRVAGEKMVIGVSCHTPEQALAAERSGADYIGAGQMFFTTAKGIKPRVIGAEGIAAIRRAVSIPLFAIGGINAQNAGVAVALGCEGVAVIGAVMAAADPEKAAREIVTAIRTAKAALHSRTENFRR